MSINYRLADLTARIRNGQSANLAQIRCPASNFQAGVLEVLKQEGYIVDYKREEISKGRQELVIDLKYYENEPVIKELKLRSKPGRRVYQGINDLPRVLNGMGIAILSTSKGIMSDAEAREKHVGGEVLCTVF